MRERGARREEVAVDVDLHHRPVRLGREVVDAVTGDDADVVHQEVEAAEGVDRLLDERVDGVLVPDVRRGDERVDSVRVVEVRGDRFQSLLAASGERDVRAVLGQRVGSGLPDAGTGTSDDR